MRSVSGRRVGLAGRSAHELRNAAARRLAEAECSASQIGAITGHRALTRHRATPPQLTKSAMRSKHGVKTIEN